MPWFKRLRNSSPFFSYANPTTSLLTPALINVNHHLQLRDIQEVLRKQFSRNPECTSLSWLKLRRNRKYRQTNSASEWAKLRWDNLFLLEKINRISWSRIKNKSTLAANDTYSRKKKKSSMKMSSDRCQLTLDLRMKEIKPKSITSEWLAMGLAGWNPIWKKSRLEASWISRWVSCLLMILFKSEFSSFRGFLLQHDPLLNGTRFEHKLTVFVVLQLHLCGLTIVELIKLDN